MLCLLEKMRGTSVMRGAFVMHVSASHYDLSDSGIISNQRTILNFFPLANKKGEITHHKFKYPIVLKSVPGNLFHILM